MKRVEKTINVVGKENKNRAHSADSTPAGGPFFYYNGGITKENKMVLLTTGFINVIEEERVKNG